MTFIGSNNFSCYLLEFFLNHHLYIASIYIQLFYAFILHAEDLLSTNKNMFLILFFNYKASGFVMAKGLLELHS